jgi:CHAP domain
MKIKNLLISFATVILMIVSGVQVFARPPIKQITQAPSSSQTQLDDFVKQGVLGNAETPSASELKVAYKTRGQRALKRALPQIGYKENPFGSNCNKFSRYFGKGCIPWCSIFVSWAFDLNGDKKLPWGNVSAVSSILDWGRKKGHIVRVPRPGDIFILKGSGQSHTGIVRSVSGRTFTTVEGNASNGVRTYRRAIHSYTYFVRVPN